MDDVILNCLIEVCCEAGSEKQLDIFAGYMAKEMGCKPQDARPYAAWVLANFDLAEKGTLAPLKASIARVAKAGSPKHES